MHACLGAPQFNIAIILSFVCDTQPENSPDAPAVFEVLGAVVDELGDQDTDCD